MPEGNPVFLSDIDLLLVAASPEAHERLFPARSELGRACEALMPEAVFAGRVDVGVMTPGELAGMPASPGVFDMRECGLLLHGDAGVLRELPSFGAGEIGPGEALRLLDNRMAAFLGTRPPGGSEGEVGRLRFLYGVSRVYTDIVTASLCAEGLYVPGYLERSRLLTGSREAEGIRRQLGESLVEDCTRWSLFKTDPSTGAVHRGTGDAAHTWLEAAGDILSVRDRIERDHPPAPRGRSGLRDIFRAWRGSVPFTFATAISRGLMPGEHVRDEALALVRHAAERGTDGTVAAAAGGYPHGRCGWEEAAAATSAEWERLVTGRDGDE
jgi:hypothetical protein